MFSILSTAGAHRGALVAPPSRPRAPCVYTLCSNPSGVAAARFASFVSPRRRTGGSPSPRPNPTPFGGSALPAVGGRRIEVFRRAAAVRSIVDPFHGACRRSTWRDWCVWCGTARSQDELVLEVGVLEGEVGLAARAPAALVVVVHDVEVEVDVRALLEVLARHLGLLLPREPRVVLLVVPPVQALELARGE
eukprot:9498713-Pyramimonas_sp.AAC.1